MKKKRECQQLTQKYTNQIELRHPQLKMFGTKKPKTIIMTIKKCK